MLLPVPHHKQQGSADCLAACLAMLLSYHNQLVAYKQIVSLLDIGPIGAPRRNIARADRLGVDVVYREATMSILIDLVRSGSPVIVFVDTEELPYWTSTTNHAFVVAGFSETAVGDDVLFVNDPAFANAPIEIAVGDFELAWLNADYMCAVISKR